MQGVRSGRTWANRTGAGRVSGNSGSGNLVFLVQASCLCLDVFINLTFTGC